MRISYASDVHLEFGYLELNNTDNSDVLILAGDILVASHLTDRIKPNDNEFYYPSKSERYYKFFDHVTKQFPTVIYVMGNHCHYNGDFSKTYDILTQYLDYPNLFILDKDYFVKNDVVFFGGTMWTNMNNSDPITMFEISQLMNDFIIVKNGTDTLHPEDVVIEFNTYFKKLKQTLKKFPDKQFVVVSHHSPSFQTCSPMFKSDHIMNGGYMSNMDQFIFDNPQISNWLYGHQHYRNEIQIGQTFIRNNSRGYISYEKMANTFELKYFDL